MIGWGEREREGKGFIDEAEVLLKFVCLGWVGISMVVAWSGAGVGCEALRAVFGMGMSNVQCAMW
jgi:hypothetical protein